MACNKMERSLNAGGVSEITGNNVPQEIKITSELRPLFG